MFKNESRLARINSSFLKFPGIRPRSCETIWHMTNDCENSQTDMDKYSERFFFDVPKKDRTYSSM